MNDTTIFDAIAEIGVIPIIAIEDAQAALPLADALVEGGLPIAEITFRTPAARTVMETLRDERPDILLGAGTVLNADNVEAAKAAGAKFAVAPGLNPAIVLKAKEVDLPFAPGIATPSDVEAGLSLDCFTLKFFPGGALGGVSMLKALSGPYAHTGVKFVPTGGVNADNMVEYLSMPVVAAVGGTWIATKADIAEGNWSGIRDKAREAADRVEQARA